VLLPVMIGGAASLLPPTTHQAGTVWNPVANTPGGKE
jgi:hypothetical protein